MKIVVCVKHVVHSGAFDFDSKKMRRESTSGGINPNDRLTLAKAVELKAGESGENASVIALSMGPISARETLLECLAFGADSALHLCDPAFAESDTLATSYALSCAIKKIENVDLVLCGSRSLDSDTGHVGVQLAEFLDLPYLSYVTDFSLDHPIIRATRIADGFVETLETEPPAVVSIDHRIAAREYPTLRGLQWAFTDGEVSVVSAADLSVDFERIGRRGSPTWVRKIITPERQRAATIIEDDKSPATVAKVLELLRAYNIFLKEEIRSRETCEKFE